MTLAVSQILGLQSGGFQGRLRGYSNLRQMLQGFAAAVRQLPDARLVLVGDNRTRPPVDPVALARQYGVEHQVEWRAYVTDEELESLAPERSASAMAWATSRKLLKVKVSEITARQPSVPNLIADMG